MSDRPKICTVWKAWRVSTPFDGWDHAIVWHKSRGKAMWHCVRGFCEAFNCSPEQALKHITIRRARRFDFEGEEPEPRMQSEWSALKTARWA